MYHQIYLCIYIYICIYGLGLDPILSIVRHLLPGFRCTVLHTYHQHITTMKHHPCIHTLGHAYLSSHCKEKQAAVSHYLIELLQA